MSPVTVRKEAVSFRSLTHGRNCISLAIDTYQRGFVWNIKQVRQLLKDLTDFHKQQQEHPGESRQYYMGSLLLHRREREVDGEQRRYVIDGQQRLSALALLYHSLNNQLPPGIDFVYRTTDSGANIRRALKEFRESHHRLPKSIFSSICFTTIEVDSEDLAFTFFDTQNGRGVPLQTTDLLKSYHLRAIEGGQQQVLQSACASRWEALQKTRPILGLKGDFASPLFNKFLWRSRRWSGKELMFEDADALMAEFGERTIQPLSRADLVPVYPSNQNFLASRIEMVPDACYKLHTQPLVLESTPARLPFSLRQPISKGVGFFLFAEKYSALLHEILNEENHDPRVKAFRIFHDQVTGNLSDYLRETFLLAVLMYVDRFGYERLLEFALCLDYSLGAKRIALSSIRMETPRKYFEESKRNLLDVIANAYIPEEVLDLIRHDPKPAKIYRESQVGAGTGVRERYQADVLEYYAKQHDNHALAGRERWITPALIERKLKEAAKA